MSDWSKRLAACVVASGLLAAGCETRIVVRDCEFVGRWVHQDGSSVEFGADRRLVFRDIPNKYHTTASDDRRATSSGVWVTPVELTTVYGPVAERWHVTIEGRLDHGADEEALGRGPLIQYDPRDGGRMFFYESGVEGRMMIYERAPGQRSACSLPPSELVL